MFRFSKIEGEHLKGLLYAGKLDDLIDEILSQFWSLPPLSQYWTIRYVKERGVYPSLEVLSSVFNLELEEARRLLYAPWREFLFPVVGREEKLIRALAILNLKGVITNLKHLRKSMETIREFLKEGFALFFDEEFSGESYMLPAVISMTCDKVPEDVLFSGKIDKRGRIHEADGLSRKRSLARRLGYRLVEVSQIKDVRSVQSWLNAEFYQVPFYITKSSGNYQVELDSFYSSLKIEDLNEKLHLLEVLNGIRREELTLSIGNLPGEQRVWEETLEKIYKRSKGLDEKLKGREYLHLAMNSPSSLALALGIVFGSQKPFTFYHYQDGRYYPIEVKNVRELKERLRTYKEIEFRLEGEGKELAVLLSLSHHELVADVKEWTRGKDLTYLIVTHRRAGNLPPESLKDIAKEVASLLQELRGKRSFKIFHFFLSSPVALSFLLGVAFGHYNLGYIYNYQRGTYFKVLDLQFLRRLREV